MSSRIRWCSDMFAIAETLVSRPTACSRVSTIDFPSCESLLPPNARKMPSSAQRQAECAEQERRGENLWASRSFDSRGVGNASADSRARRSPNASPSVKHALKLTGTAAE
jgi:hypothetical protein